MSLKERLEKNLGLLGRITPKVALQLQYVEPIHVQVAQTKQGEANGRVERDGHHFFLHSNYSAEAESKAWFQSLNLGSHVTVLFVYGVGMGHYFDAAKSWLDASAGHYLVFIEDDMEVLYRLLETEKGTEILDHKQVQLHAMSTLEESEPMLQWLAWFFVLSCPEVSCLRAYDKEKGAQFTALCAKLLHDSAFVDSVAAEYMRHGRSYYRNFYRNMLQLEHSYHGNGLFGRFEGVPAIICGAGPSLNKHVEQLRELKDRALIFAGGSALNALSSKGVLPHFGAGIDPNPAQYERLINNQGYEVPFFYRNRMYDEAFRAIHGQKLYLTGAGGYDIAQWFDEQLGIDGETLDEGHNVVNFCVEIARHLGCQPILFVGMDLSYTGMRAYADGVTLDAQVDQAQILNAPSSDMAAFLRPDIHGNPVYTLWKWVGESQWMSEYAHKFPETQFINATEGGIGFEGVPNWSLAQAASAFFPESQDMNALVHGQIQLCPLRGVSVFRVLELMREIRESLLRCQALSAGLVEEAQVVLQAVKEGKPYSENLQTGRMALFEEDLSEELAYTKALALPAQVCNKVLARRLHQIRYDKELPTDRDKDRERLLVSLQKFRFIHESATCNLYLLEEAVRKYAEEGHSISSFFPPEKQQVSS